MSRKKEPAIVESSQKVFKVAKLVSVVLAVLILIIGISISLMKQPDRVAADQSAQPDSQAAETSVDQITLPLETGVWFDLRRNRLLLPNRRLDLDYFGCIEIIYNSELPRVLCEGDSEPEVALSAGSQRADSNWRYEETIRNVRVRTLSEDSLVIMRLS